MRIELHKGALSAEGVQCRDAVTLSVAGEDRDSTAVSTLPIKTVEIILGGLQLACSWPEGAAILKRDGVTIDFCRTTGNHGSVVVAVRECPGPTTLFRCTLTLEQADDLSDMLSTLLFFMEGESPDASEERDRHGV